MQPSLPFLKHGVSYVLMRRVIYKIINETFINDGTIFVCFSATSFVTGFISYMTTKLCQNSIHYYPIFVFKFVVRVIWILMVTLLGMFQFIAFITNHIRLPSFTSLLLFGWWFQQFMVFINVSHTFFTSDCNNLARKRVVNKLFCV